MVETRYSLVSSDWRSESRFLAKGIGPERDKIFKLGENIF